jgi:hypothetical protein
MTGLAAVLLAHVASTILSIAYATTVLGRTVGFLLFDPVFAARIAYDRGGTVRWYVVVAACVIVGQVLLRTFVARLVVASAGAPVGLGRALVRPHRRLDAPGLARDRRRHHHPVLGRAPTRGVGIRTGSGVCAAAGFPARLALLGVLPTQVVNAADGWPAVE